MRSRMNRMLWSAATLLAACGVSEARLGGDDDSTNESALGLSKKVLGDTTCAVGASDCNVCVNDVFGTVDRGFGGRFVWSTGRWDFTWERQYPPSNAKPIGVFHDGVALIDGPEHHVQGFVHTNSADVPFMVTHSDDTKGGIGRIDKNRQLATLIRSNDNHPSGGQVLGDSFLFTEVATLRVVNVTGAERSQLFPLPKPAWATTGQGLSGGGVGAVKLRDGRTLVISSTPGGDAAGTRRTLFFVKAGALTAAAPFTLLAETEYAQPTGWKGDYQRSENLSVITECGTGTIFTLHATGDRELYGRGYFRLSRVDTVNGLPKLTTVKAYGMDQSIWDCHLRSSGTAWARADHSLGIACHEWLARRGIFGWNDDGDFSFRTAR